MRKAAALLLSIAFALCLTACNSDDLGKQTSVNEEQGYTEFNTVNSFDFSDYKKEHKDIARTDGFKNVQPKQFHNKTDAKELAKNELPEGYKFNNLKIFFDPTEGIWMVEYSTVNEAGETTAKLCVCVEDTGYTKLIVEEQ